MGKHIIITVLVLKLKISSNNIVDFVKNVSLYNKL